MKVGFFIIGAQKCGTTALATFLREAHSIHLPAKKELHFFDDEAVDWSRPTLEAYHAHFDARRSGALWGEATPSYIYWPGALERIHAYNASARLIVILRDPVARAFSHWRMQRVRGVEPLPFAYAIRGGRGRLRRDGRLTIDGRRYSYVERGFYADQLERVYRLFDAENVCVLTTADLRRDHAGTLAKVGRFLGVSWPKLPPRSEIHTLAGEPLEQPRAEDVAYLRALYEPDARTLADRYGLRLEDEL